MNNNDTKKALQNLTSVEWACGALLECGDIDGAATLLREASAEAEHPGQVWELRDKLSDLYQISIPV